MSILLEALKKSEEQRQLGKTPGIHSPGGEPPGTPAGTQQWIPLALTALAAIAMAWIGWQQYRLPAGLEDGAALARAGSDAQLEAAAEQGAAPGTDAAVEPEPADAGAGTAVTDTAVARRPGVSLRTPVEGFRPETKALQNVTILPPTDFQSEERQKAELSRSVSTFDVQAEQETAAAVADGAPADAPAEPGAAPAVAAQELPPPAAESQPRQSRAETHIPEPISYWELPQGVRDNLPEMHITVLVYSERPQDRFLLVSGQRMVEKDQLEDGVVLEEIRRDGAVFQYRTYRFLLKG